MNSQKKTLLSSLLCIIISINLLTACNNTSKDGSNEQAVLKFEQKYYATIDKAVEETRKITKNPSTLKIHSIYLDYAEELNGKEAPPVVYLYTSADNDMGGTKDALICYDAYEDLIYKSDLNIKECMNESTYKIKHTSTFYSNNKDLKKSTKWIFKVDLNDYKIPDQY